MKKTFFFNSGLCRLFSEKQYICFLVNILAALLIIFVPNLVRKCQILCSRIWVEKIMFLKIFGTVSKENRFLLATIATVVKEIFPQFISRYFLSCYFCRQNFLTGLEGEIFFLEDFLLFVFPWQEGPQFGHIPTFFCGFVNFSFISTYWQIFKLVLFYLRKIYCFKEKVLLWNPHLASSLIWGAKYRTCVFFHR